MYNKSTGPTTTGAANPNVTTASSTTSNEWEQYKGRISAPVLDLIASAEGKPPAKQVEVYAKAWDLASAWEVLDGVEDHPGMVYALIKRGDACLACAAVVQAQSLITTSSSSNNSSSSTSVSTASSSNTSSSNSLEGLAKRWQSNYSLAARFYAAARVKAEEYKCVDVFGEGLFPKRLANVAQSFIQQECAGAKNMPELDYTTHTEKLKQIRAEVKKQVEKPDVVAKELLAYITSQFKAMVAAMLPECVAALGKPPCSYAIVGLGSMSRNEMGPFSDVELAVILERSDRQSKDYFYKLMCLVEWKITCIGETELPRTLAVDTHSGFGIDIGGNIPGHKVELMGTIEELVKQQTPKRFGGDGITLNALRTVCLIDGNIELVGNYRRKLAVRLDERSKGGNTPSIREEWAIELFGWDVYDFEPKLGQKKEEEQFNIKKELYRLPSNLANYLSLYYGIDAQSSWEKLDKLVEGGFITAEARKNVAELLDFATIMRVKTHSFYGHEKEDIYHKRLLNDENGLKRPLVIYEINDEEQKQLELCYRVLIPIHRGIKDFTDKRAPKDFRQLVLYDDSLFVQAQTAEKMLLYKEALGMYEKALSLDPDNVGILIEAGNIKLTLAEPNALESLQKTLQIAIQKYGEQHPDVATCYNNIGLVLHAQGKHEKALEHFRLALGIRRQMHGEQHPDVAAYYNNIGAVLHKQGKHEQSVVCHKEALQIWKQVCGEQHPGVSSSYNNIGLVLRAQGKHEEALKYHQQALDIRRQVYGEQHPDVAACYNNIGAVLHAQGKHEKALEHFRLALGIRRQVYGEQHPDVAGSYNNIGEVLRKQGKHEEALKYHQQALDIRRQVYGEQHPDDAASYSNIASVLHAQGEHKEALKYDQQALDIQRQMHGEQHPDVAASYNNIGEVLRKQGKHEEALKYYQQALDIQRQVYGEQHPDVAASYNNIGLVLDVQGEHKEALKYYQQALQIWKQVYGEQHPDVAASYNNIGALLHAQSKHEKALEHFRRALDIQRQMHGEQHPDVAAYYNNIGLVLRAQGKYEEALKYYQQALKLKRQLFGEQHPDVAAYYNNIASVLHAQGKHEEAEQYIRENLAQVAMLMRMKGEHEEAIENFKQALGIRRQVYGEQHPDVAAYYNNIASVLHAQGKHEEASKYALKSLASHENIGLLICLGIIFSPLILATAIVCCPCLMLYACARQPDTEVPPESSDLTVTNPLLASTALSDDQNYMDNRSEIDIDSDQEPDIKINISPEVIRDLKQQKKGESLSNSKFV